MSQSSEKVTKSHKLVLKRAKMLETSKKRDKLVKENWQVTEKKDKKWHISEKMPKASVKKDTEEWKKVTIKDKLVKKDAK